MRGIQKSCYIAGSRGQAAGRRQFQKSSIKNCGIKCIKIGGLLYSSLAIIQRITRQTLQALTQSLILHLRQQLALQLLPQQILQQQPLLQQPL